MQNENVKPSFLLLVLLSQAHAYDVTEAAPMTAAVGLSSFAFPGEPQAAQGTQWIPLSQLPSSRWPTVELLRFPTSSSEAASPWFLASSFFTPSLEVYTYAQEKRQTFLLPALKEVRACGIPYHTLLFNDLSVTVRC